MTPEELKKKLDQLPETELETSWSKEDLWDSLESQLSKSTGKHRFLHAGLRVLPWAAAVLFTIGMYWWTIKEPTIKIETESMSPIQESSMDLTETGQLDEGKQLIRETCDKQLEVCSTPQFKSLYSELLQIEEEKYLLSGIIDQYGSDEISTKALIELQNAESSITSKLIALIMT